MLTRSAVKRTVLCALCIALCCVLPVTFHSFAIGKALSPLHIPVLLCGIVCGPWYGLLCGIAGPILSSIVAGMPPVVKLVYMVPELATYALVGGLMMRAIHTKHLLPDVYLSMIAAMVMGRIVGGIASALFHLGTTGSYGYSMFVGSYLVGTLPGIVAHLILVPLLVVTLEKARAIPVRYPQKMETMDLEA